jgi:hypothetical protein
MTQVKAWFSVTVTVAVALTATVGGICATAVHFAKSPNSFQMDVVAQPNRVQIRTRVQGMSQKTFSDVDRNDLLID